MRLNKFLWLAGVCIAFVSCQMSQDRMRGIEISGFDDKELANGDSLPLASFEVIPLETDTDCIITEVKKIIDMDSLFVLVTERRVMAFDRDGHYSRDFGERGRGTGEYLMVSTAYWDVWSRTLNVVDAIRRRFFSYALSGQLAATWKLNQENASLVNTAESYSPTRLFCANYLYNDQNEVFTILDLERNSQESVAKFAGRTDNTQEYTGRHPFSLHDGRVTCIFPYSNVLKVYEEVSGEELAPTFTILTKEKILDKKEQAEIEDFGIMRYAEQMNNGTFVGFTDVFETENYYMLAFYNIYYVLIEKSTGQLKKYDYTVPSGSLGHVPLFNILATGADDSLVGYVDAFRLKSWEISGDSDCAEVVELHDAASSLNESDNGCLFIYHLR